MMMRKLNWPPWDKDPAAPWYDTSTADRRRRMRRGAAAFAGVAVTAVAAYAISNWVVGLNPGSNGVSQSGTVSNLTIAATASPPPNEQVYPGGTSDAIISITNPNGFPVTVTGFNLPANSTYAGGYTTIGLTTPQSGCTTSNSGVYWSFATGSSGSAHTLTTPVVVAPNGSLVVELDGDTSMGLSSPVACENTYFSMPSLTGVAATAGGGTPTTSPVLDSWTS